MHFPSRKQVTIFTTLFRCLHVERCLQMCCSSTTIVIEQLLIKELYVCFFFFFSRSNSACQSPALAYAIAHNSGTVWCLEWCPSGCYQDIDLCNYKTDERKLMRRMGLLAAACSDGCVNIYSLPFADELGYERTEYNS